MMMPKGTAYALFDCSAEPLRIFELMKAMMHEPDARDGLRVEYNETKSMIGTFFAENILMFTQLKTYPSYMSPNTRLPGSRRLIDLPHALRATHTRTDSQAIAGDLARMVNGIYENFELGKDFTTAIVYRGQNFQFDFLNLCQYR